ncbi:MAG: 50S ribosomal protein L23 [Holosporaceae bacterium]
MKGYRFQKKPAAAPVSLSKLPFILKGLLVTEKSTLGTQDSRYTFKVAMTADKKSIKQAVEHFFKVNVVSVNTLRVPGKQKRFKGRLGMTTPFKKAIVALKKGQMIDTPSDTGAEG